MESEEFDTSPLAATHAEAALRVQKGWEVSLDGSEAGQCIRFRRVGAEYSESIVTPDGVTCVGGEIGCSSFKPSRVREDFFALKTDQEALAFFSKYGPFRFQLDWRDHSLPEDRLYEEFVGEPRALTLSEIKQHQERLQEIAVSPPAFWLPPKKQGQSERLNEFDKLVALGPLPRINPKGGAPPFFTMEAICVRQAIATTLFLDAVAEKPYRRCVRCGTLFAENESRKKRFCNADCSLRVRIARSRERAKKAKIASRANP